MSIWVYRCKCIMELLCYVFFSLSFSFSFFSLYCVNNKCYIIIGGQHRWASAYLAACHHIIYYISDMCYSLMANKIVVVVVGQSPIATRPYSSSCWGWPSSKNPKAPAISNRIGMKCGSNVLHTEIDGVRFLIWRHKFKMVAMASFHVEICRCLASWNKASVGAYTAACPPVPDLNCTLFCTCYLCTSYYILFNSI